MTQRPLFKRQGPTVLSKRKEADSGNLAMARLILANPERYEGLQALWAKAVLRKSEAGS